MSAQAKTAVTEEVKEKAGATVTRKVGDPAVTFSINVPLTIDTAPDRWTEEQIDIAFNRGVREMFGAVLAARAKAGQTQAQIQAYFDNEWHPGMSPERGPRKSPSEKAEATFVKSLEGKTDDEILNELNSLTKRAQEMAKKIKNTAKAAH